MDKNLTILQLNKEQLKTLHDHSIDTMKNARYNKELQARYPNIPNQRHITKKSSTPWLTEAVLFSKRNVLCAPFRIQQSPQVLI